MSTSNKLFSNFLCACVYELVTWPWSERQGGMAADQIQEANVLVSRFDHTGVCNQVSKDRSSRPPALRTREITRHAHRLHSRFQLWPGITPTCILMPTGEGPQMAHHVGTPMQTVGTPVYKLLSSAR